MSRKSKQTYFQEAWLTCSEFSFWIARGKVNTEARCKLCKSNFELSNMGVISVKSHNKSKGHQKLVREKEQIANFFKKKTKEIDQSVPLDSEVTESVPDSQSSSIQTTISSSFKDGGKLHAEIRWCLKHVLSGYSGNSMNGSCELFGLMFPDSKIASQMELGKTKLMYIVNHGLGPHFREELKREASASEWYVVSFDESLNKTVQECEMDLIIRFWDNLTNTVQVRFWNSMFLGYSTATDLVKNFHEGLTGIDPSKNVQISMDGPNVNLKFLETVKKEREEANLSKLIDIGSCDLHTVHGSFKSACEKTEWHLKSLLKSSFQIFKDSPARREDYICITGSSEFPLQFCAVRYVYLEALPCI